MVAVDSSVRGIVVLEDLTAVPRAVHLHLGHLRSELLLGRALLALKLVATGGELLREELRHASPQLRVVDTATASAAGLTATERRRKSQGYVCRVLGKLLGIRVPLLVPIHKTSASELDLQGLSRDAEVHPAASIASETPLSVAPSKMVLLD